MKTWKTHLRWMLHHIAKSVLGYLWYKIQKYNCKYKIQIEIQNTSNPCSHLHCTWHVNICPGQIPQTEGIRLFHLTTHLMMMMMMLMMMMMMENKGFRLFTWPLLSSCKPAENTCQALNQFHFTVFLFFLFVHIMTFHVTQKLWIPPKSKANEKVQISQLEIVLRNCKSLSTER